MDAKPQRPLRSFKVRDENAVPDVVQAKSIHQRNKSSPALSTLSSQQAGWRFGAKRTAFADVSNTSRTNQTVKDDSSIATNKPAVVVGIKEISSQENNRSLAPLLKPAQRPLSVGGIKNFLGTFMPASSNAVPKQPSGLPAARLDQDQLNKLRPYKSIAVLKDIGTIADSQPSDTRPRLQFGALESVQENELGEGVSLPADNPLGQPEMPELAITTTTSASQVHPLPPLPPASLEATALPSTAAARVSAIPLSSSSGLYEDANTHVLQVPTTTREPLQPTTKQPLPREIITHESLPPSEQAETWDEEGYEERYEDEGYTTARSLKSRDLTTGHTTIVLAPRVTIEVELELAAAARFMQDSNAVEDIEDDEKWDTSMVSEYGNEIFSYMRSLEDRMTPNPYYMDNQAEVQWSMRAVLMDWLIQVHHRFQLLPETLFLCVNYIDRFLSCKVVSINKLQLVGATAILVASKYEEITCPTVAEIQYMVEGSYTIEEILKAERFMLSMLQFELGWPGPMSFLRRISKADSYDLETRTLAKYFLEVTIMDERFVACTPSFTAAGAHCLARLLLNHGSWSKAHIFHSGYTYSQLHPLMVTILGCCDDPRKHHSAVFEKYGDKRYKGASFFVQTQMDHGFVLPPVARWPLTGAYDGATYI